MSQRLQVLVVDDEPGLCSGVARFFRKLQVEAESGAEPYTFTVRQAETGAQARALWQQMAFDLFLIDYKLPDADGLDLIRELRLRQADAAIIMITAFASLEVAVAATKNGAFDFLPKPFSPEELEAVVRRAIRQLLLQRRARALEQERRRARFEFLTVLAHELKAPLGAVENYLHLMRDGLRGPHIADYRGDIERALTRLEGMRKMIRDLLDLTRIESGEKQRDLQKVDVAAVVSAALETHAGAAAAHNVTLTSRVTAPLEMTADRGELEIILNNLISNAIKYNRPGGRVDIEAEADETSVTLRVQDTGIGMKPEDTARLFREFVRIRNEHTAAIPGSGLGLSIVRKLAHLYGGDVTVCSAPNVGSTFTVTLRRDGGLKAESREVASTAGCCEGFPKTRA